MVRGSAFLPLSYSVIFIKQNYTFGQMNHCIKEFDKQKNLDIIEIKSKA